MKGDFDPATPLEIELLGQSTIDLGRVRRQLFSQFLEGMPLELGLIEENKGVVFPTCVPEHLLGQHYFR